MVRDGVSVQNSTLVLLKLFFKNSLTHPEFHFLHLQSEQNNCCFLKNRFKLDDVYNYLLFYSEINQILQFLKALKGLLFLTSAPVSVSLCVFIYVYVCTSICI